MSSPVALRPRLATGLPLIGPGVLGRVVGGAVGWTDTLTLRALRSGLDGRFVRGHATVGLRPYYRISRDHTGAHLAPHQVMGPEPMRCDPTPVGQTASIDRVAGAPRVDGRCPAAGRDGVLELLRRAREQREG